MITQGLHEILNIEVSNHYQLPTSGGWNRTITVTFKSGESLDIDLFADDYGRLIFNFEPEE